MFFKVWRYRGEQEISSGEPDCPQVPETPYGVSGNNAHVHVHIYIPKDTANLYFFYVRAKRIFVFS